MFKPLMLSIALALCACTASNAPQGTKPKPISRLNPNYPVYAVDNKIEGYVKLRYDVGADGKVSEVRILDAQPRGLFEDKVIAAMAQWRFEKNQPYKDVDMTVRFKMASAEML
ncbi:transport protein TonB [Serratia ficaria]|uniref:TonB family protein n=1 Tax=Serratia ficaria TaxID=61651 RepID=UPI00119C1770|nr:TonB family protein [Serratia ficaria]VVA49365.1 transport protein TonB [Serratia ficaria]